MDKTQPVTSAQAATTEIRLAQANFDRACAFEIRFGKRYAGRTLAQIGQDDKGLLYLDWLLSCAWLRDPALSAIKTYLNFGPVSAKVNAAIEAKGNTNDEE